METLFLSIRLPVALFICYLFVTPAYCQPGSIDLTFNPGTGANGDIFTSAIQSDGKILIAGDFTSYNGTARNYLARLNTDGSLDAAFNSGNGPNQTIYKISLESNGKIIIAGTFTTYNFTPVNNILRLNSDGTIGDLNPGMGPNSYIRSTAIQADGKIIVVGPFTTFNGSARKDITRLNTNGTIDAGFNSGTATNNAGITNVSVQSDGKIIIGGSFTSYNGTPVNRIARLNSDGTLDATFTGTGANNTVLTSTVQPDGKIIIGGIFNSYNGTAAYSIARLNSDGTIDAGFTPGTTAINSVISTIALQSDGKIIIGGDFMSYNGTPINRIARLNIDGTLDAGFNPGTGANSSIQTITIQPDSKIIIGGYFYMYDGTSRERIARVNGSGVSSSTNYFRTITSGNWNAASTWESSTSSNFATGVVSPATLSPDLNANTITIRNGHTVTISANVTVDQLVINPGSTVVVQSSVVFTVL